jgi:hypothetical protein
MLSVILMRKAAKLFKLLPVMLMRKAAKRWP